jgi:hypothetical protein
VKKKNQKNVGEKAMGEVVEFSKRKKSTEVAKTEEKTEFSFDEIMKQNEEKRQRLERERTKSNHGVTKSYRLKQ